MTGHRSERVYLPANVDRCDPSAHCAGKTSCARYMAALPASGAAMSDYSNGTAVPLGFCAMWVGLQAFKPEAAKAAPRVFGPVRGLE